MENFTVTLSVDKEVFHFQIAEYLHHESGGCKYKVFQQGKMAASFEADRQHLLHICQNPAGLDEELLHLLADQIEIRHPNESHLTDLEAIEFDRDDEMEAPPQKI